MTSPLDTRNKDAEALEDLRKYLASDIHRPRYHFLPPANWMNDPNGLIHWRGEFHLFFQHNPFGPGGDQIHWGHTISTDLVHWRDLPIALAPTPGGPDQYGCWSGCAVDAGLPTLIYTGKDGKCETVCLATSRDDLLTWEKDPDNPVLEGPPEGLPVTGFRDPYVWHDQGSWWMVLGSGTQAEGGMVLLYRSDDLHHWQYLNPIFYEGDCEDGAMWECPNFFSLPLVDSNGKMQQAYVLLVSSIRRRHVRYFVGDFRDHRFVSRLSGVVDAGGYFYASLVMVDATGRRVMLGWMPEGRSDAAQHAAGWAGVQSLPRKLSLAANGDLSVEPIAEIEGLRAEHYHAGKNDLPLSQVRQDEQGMTWHDRLLPVSGRQLEIDLHVIVDHHQLDWDIGLKVFSNNSRLKDSGEETLIAYHHAGHQLEIDRRSSSRSVEAHRDVRGIKFAPSINGKIRLRLFLDGSMIEVFASSGEEEPVRCLSSRVYPTDEHSGRLILTTRNMDFIQDISLDIWKLKSIWNGDTDGS